MQFKSIFLAALAAVWGLLSSSAQAQGLGLLPDGFSWDAIPAAFHLGGSDSVSCAQGVGCADPAGDFAGVTGCDRRCRCWDSYGDVELLLWWTKGTHLPPLVTTSPPGTPRAEAGVLGAPGTTVLFGDGLAGQDLQVGGRVTMGWWLDASHNFGVEGRFFALEGDSTTFFAQSTGDPILGIPFFNPALPGEDAFLVAFPGVSEGSVRVNFTNDLFGTEVLGRIMMRRDQLRRVDLLAGYQFLRLDDDLRINSLVTSTDPLSFVPIGTTFDVFDRFRGRNEFHGGVVGLQGSMARGCWSLNGTAKVGLGNMRQTVVIEGAQTITIPNSPGTTSGSGLFAQPSNIGSRTQDQFCFIPEVTLSLRYHFTDCLSASFGYNLIWMSDVVLGADHIDRVVDLSQNTARPAFTFDDTDYWVQGMNFGLHYDF